jgi:TldD protein
LLLPRRETILIGFAKLMKPWPIRVLRYLPFLLLAITSLSLAGTGPAAESLPPVMQAMELELHRSMTALGEANPPAYFVSYTISDVTEAEVMGSNGALLESNENHNRVLETQVRVGSYQLDDTHTVGEHREAGSSSPRLVTIENDIPVLRRSIWLATDRQYRRAAEAYIRVKTSKQVQAESAESQVADFSREQPHVSIGKAVTLAVDRQPWEERVRRYTAAFSASPAVMNSIATFTARADTQYQVTSEGTRLAFGQVRYRLELFVQAKAPDGMDINRYANFDWVDPADAPADAVVLARVGKMIGEVAALQKAPLVDPYAGPAMLSGRAAAVFFHEVLGHRLEGFRQKDITEGQTFTRKIGEQIMPDFISVYDDPTMARLGSKVLLGYYPFDDEGVSSERVTLVAHGVLKNFLMSRSPLRGFPHSNGHGRRQIGFEPLSRMGNTIVESSRRVSNAELRRMLIEEVRRQKKPYGLFIDDIAGGFTFTGRGQPQAFQVQPLIVYKIFPDGRPDELVRGVDIVGTPLVSLTKIVATGNREEVFNGYCGAESGSVPVAAVAPAILISELEVQKKETSTDKPPILPPPLHDPEAKGSRP